MRCRKCTRAEVSNTAALARTLDRMGVEYRIVDDTHADLYADIQITRLSEALSAENCILYSMREQDESLESFYMNLVGGERHA